LVLWNPLCCCTCKSESVRTPIPVRTAHILPGSSKLCYSFTAGWTFISLLPCLLIKTIVRCHTHLSRDLYVISRCIKLIWVRI
jgi:hypothetical protein